MPAADHHRDASLRARLARGGRAAPGLTPAGPRPIALAVVRRGDRILAHEAHDPVKGQAFYRPLGGTIEFGERGAEAVVRELREEIGVEAAATRFLGTLESIFTYLGRPGHEIVLVYEVELVDDAVYGRERITASEGDVSVECAWLPLETFERVPLYPDGLLELVRSSANAP